MAKKYIRKVDKKMRDYGDIDDKKKIIRVNPKKGGLLNTIIHEELHSQHPKKPEKWISKETTKQEGNLTIKGAMRLLTRYRK